MTHKTKQTGIFGGSFDPVHKGHLQIARRCRDFLPLDEVLLVPAASQPFKPSGSIASAEHRVRMLQLAIEDVDGLTLCPVEIERGGVSYTVDTLRTLAAARPADRLHLILGADALIDLPNWRDPQTIGRLATLVAVDRPGSPSPAQLAIPTDEASAAPTSVPVRRVPMEPIDISSTEIRDRVARHEPIGDLVPAKVAIYISDHGLYG